MCGWDVHTNPFSLTQCIWALPNPGGLTSKRNSFFQHNWLVLTWSVVLTASLCRILKIGKDLRDNQLQPNHQQYCPLTTSFSATSPRFLSSSKDGDSTTVPGQFQHAVTLLAKTLFLSSNLQHSLLSCFCYLGDWPPPHHKLSRFRTDPAESQGFWKRSAVSSPPCPSILSLVLFPTSTPLASYAHPPTSALQLTFHLTHAGMHSYGTCTQHFWEAESLNWPKLPSADMRHASKMQPGNGCAPSSAKGPLWRLNFNSN